MNNRKYNYSICQNCGEQLTTEEKEKNTGWCDYCELPEESEIQ